MCRISSTRNFTCIAQLIKPAILQKLLRGYNYHMKLSKIKKLLVKIILM